MAEAKKTSDGVAFDLDALERESTTTPFVAKVNGDVVNFADPQELDWQVLTNMDPRNPRSFLRSVIAPDDQDAFFAAKIPGWKMNKLMESYLEHYGLPTTPGELRALSGY